MLLKPKKGVDFMVERIVDASWWSQLIANPLVKNSKDDAPLAIFGKPTDTVELNKEGYMRCIGDNVEEIYALPVDVDNGTTMADFEKDFHRYAYQLYTTYSWHNGKPGDRFRVFFPLKAPIKVKWLVKPVKDKLMELFSMADKSCFDKGHWQCLPCISRKDAPYRYVQHVGEMLSFEYDGFDKIAEEYENDMKAYLKKLEEERNPDEDKTWMLRHTQKVFDETLEGERDKTVYNKLMWLRDNGFTYGDVMALRPPMGFEREYRLKVNRLFGFRGF